MLCAWAGVAQTALPASVQLSPQSVLSAEAPHVSESSRTQPEQSCSADWVAPRPVTLQCVSGISLQEISAFLVDWAGVSRAQ